MIKSFANKETAAVFAGERPRRLSLNVLSVAIRKIAQLDAVQSVNELSVPPGNRLEKLSGTRQGQYRNNWGQTSIRQFKFRRF